MGPFSCRNPSREEHPGPPADATNSVCDRAGLVISHAPFVQKRRSFTFEILLVGQNLGWDRHFLPSLYVYARSQPARTHQKKSLRVSFFAPEMGIKPAHDGPASKFTDPIINTRRGSQPIIRHSPSGIFVPSTKNSFALGLEKLIGDSRLATVPGTGMSDGTGPRKSRRRSSCSRWMFCAASMPSIALPANLAKTPVAESKRAPSSSLRVEVMSASCSEV